MNEEIRELLKNILTLKSVKNYNADGTEYVVYLVEIEQNKQRINETDYKELEQWLGGSNLWNAESH